VHAQGDNEMLEKPRCWLGSTTYSLVEIVLQAPAAAPVRRRRKSGIIEIELGGGRAQIL
jgi:hypothetical protein